MQSSEFDAVLKQKTAIDQSRKALIWAALNLTFATFLFLDITNGSVSRHISFSKKFESLQPVVWYIEFFLAVLFSWNTFFDFVIYLRPIISNRNVDLKPIHKVLFGIKENEPGFKTTSTKEPVPITPQLTSTPKLSFLLPSSQSPNQSSSSYGRLVSTPLDYSASSWGSSSYSTSPNLSLTSSSWSYVPGSTSPSPLYFPVESSQSYLPETPELRQRKNIFNISSSPLPNRDVTDEKGLEQYLKDYEAVEQKSQSMTQENQATNIPSFWNYPISPIGTLRKFQYQLATHRFQSAATLADDPDSPTTFSGDRVWMKLKISEANLNNWIENLRKWLTQTILLPVVSEIESINEMLRRLGSPDVQIGDVSLSSLRQVALTKSTLIPTFCTLIPYLDCTTNQEYLVQRLRDLANGGCMSEFRWNSGGQYKGKPWTDLLPTDSAIVMHMFCTYLDSRLPPHPTYPDGKTFTSQYFKKATDKPAIMKDTLCLFQSRNFPPHYRVIMSDDTWDLPKGRNNMFCAILLFLYHVKTKHCGMLGRINLGPSGVNILWVIES